MSRVRPGAAAFFVLLVITLVAAVVVVRARTPDLVLEETGTLPTTFDPANPDPPRELAISFFVREDDDDASVQIVDSTEDLVRTLDEGVALRAGEEVTYRWDGRTDEGTPVPEGRYRLAVELPASDRRMIWPQRITVDREPYETTSLGAEDPD